MRERERRSKREKMRMIYKEKDLIVKEIYKSNHICTRTKVRRCNDSKAGNMESLRYSGKRSKVYNICHNSSGSYCLLSSFKILL